jgi:hypothetical protein
LEKPEPENVSERLIAEVQRAFRDQEYLPGFDAFIEKHPEATKWLDEQCFRMDKAIHDNDPVLFERALGSWAKAVERVNELVAEEYRQAHSDPLTWELRFFKWMARVKWMKFDCALGEFYVVPRPPASGRKPKAKYWYTADEMIDMLQPGVAIAIKGFQQLPTRPDSLPGPDTGEATMHLKPGDPVRPIWYSIKGGGR